MFDESLFYIAYIDVDIINNKFSITDTSSYISSDITDVDEEIIEQVYNIYKKTYARIDKKLSINKMHMLLKYNVWILFTNKHKEIEGFAIYRIHDCGLKLGLTGTTGNKTAKTFLIEFHKKSLNTAGVFAEISDALENVLDGNVPFILYTAAQKILSSHKLKKSDKSKFHYWREIKNIGLKEKILAGKPLIKK